MDTVTAAAFLDALYATATPGRFVNLSGYRLNGNGAYAIDDGNPVWSDRIGVAEVGATADLPVEPYDRWYTVQPRIEAKRGSEANTAEVVTTIADFDYADSSPGKDPAASFTTLASVQEFCAAYVPLPPSALIESGHGVHAYWFLDEPVEPREGKELLVRFDTHLQAAAKAVGKHLDPMKDLARVLRLPGTMNLKNPSDPRPVVVADLHPDRRYAVDDFDFLPDVATVTVNPDTASVRNVEIRDWFETLPDGNAGRNLIDDWVAEMRGATPGSPEKGRHPTAMHLLGVAAREAQNGNVDFKAAAVDLRQAFLTLFDDRNAAVDDFNKMTARVVKYRIAEPDTGALTLTVDIPAAGLPWQPLNWADFWEQDHHLEWILEPVLPKGRLVALFAKGKAGKSLLTLEWAAALATGRETLWREAGEPIHVVYIDAEMTEADIQDRLYDLGYTEDDNLDHLHYYLLQHMPPLDTEAGGDALLSIAQLHSAQIVIIDTVSRVISGNENDADTFLALYRNTGMRLKAAGITFLRLDHTGKDEKKGQRGSSAKDQDADLVWQLRDEGIKIGADHKVTLTAKASRLSLQSDTIRLVRRFDPLRHELVGGTKISQAAVDVLKLLDELELPADTGRDRARKALKTAGKKAKNQPLSEAIRWRKKQRGQVEGTGFGDRSRGQVGTGQPETAETVTSTTETAGDRSRGQVKTDLSPLGATPLRGGTQEGGGCSVCGEAATPGMIAGKKYCASHDPTGIGTVGVSDADTEGWFPVTCPRCGDVPKAIYPSGLCHDCDTQEIAP